MIEFRNLGKRDAALRGSIWKGFNIWSEKTGWGFQPLGCWKRKIGKILVERVGIEETLEYEWAGKFSVVNHFSVLLSLPACHREQNNIVFCTVNIVSWICSNKVACDVCLIWNSAITKRESYLHIYSLWLGFLLCPSNLVYLCLCRVSDICCSCFLSGMQMGILWGWLFCYQKIVSWSQQSLWPYILWITSTSASEPNNSSNLGREKWTDG